MSALVFLLPALLACVLLTLIHTYLGIHVLARGVIFVDIALAQVAALGMTVAFLLGYDADSQAAYFFALGFTVVGAFFFAYFRDDRAPQEAVIGVTFATSSALAILIASELPHGAEHLEFILSGNILWVSWQQLAKTALIYGVLGLFHYRFRDRFLLVSHDPQAARAKGLSIWMWDLLFYVSFGLVITSSVQIGGVLLVFSFLIVPSLCSLLFLDGLRARLIAAWVIGIAVSVGGIGLSYLRDWPTGPTIVTVFGAVLVMGLLARKLKGING